MRIKLGFELLKTTVPLDYRPAFISFVKNALERMYPEFYNYICKNKSTLLNGFTFSLYLQNPKIINNIIELSDPEIQMSISTLDYPTMIQLHNALSARFKKDFAIPLENSMKLVSISILPPKIISGDSCKIKFLSPLLLKHNIDNKDMYVDFENDLFNDILNIQIKEMCHELRFHGIKDSSVKIIAVNPKRTVIKCLGRKFNSSYGEYIIKGEERLLNYLYQTGIGARRYHGFGMFELL